MAAGEDEDGPATGRGPGNTQGTGTGGGSGATGGKGPSIAGGAGGPGGDTMQGRGASAEDVPREVDEEDDAAVDLGSELSFPASDPPAYMGAGAITGPPLRDESRPEAPVIAEADDLTDPRDDPSAAPGGRAASTDPSEAAAGSEVGGDLDIEEQDSMRGG